MMNKKAQGLSVHTIILAVIGLIILVVIVLMLTGKLGDFGKGAESASESYIKTCEELGGASLEDRETGCQSWEEPIISKDAFPGLGKNCCRCKTWDGVRCA